ncbi:HHL250Wp [Eremothecium sinecaudum]|uniref:HHL250Wp n=1 Tax=Eremothecium sinecaudum TaxID=45286 RepID=A0A0X8HW63_9SACH|nr:HHL250Wp [Eremothecium sinecaudum]AMD22520.1 HHL250Wp [Eremothecium sinecaudum]
MLRYMYQRKLIGIATFCRFQSSGPHWFYATDIPVTKPYDPEYKPTEEPKKFTPFSKHDSDRIERLYNLNPESKDPIAVNEDYLFEVCLKNKTLKPKYWEGSLYEVRRGLWFINDDIPLPYELSVEIEEYSKQYSPNNDVFPLKGTYSHGKYVMFSSSNASEAYLISDISRGGLQLSLLRTSKLISSATKVTRGYSGGKDGIIMKAAKEIEHQLLDQTKHLGKLSDKLGGELKELLSGYSGGHSNNMIDNAMEKEMEGDYDNKNNRYNSPIKSNFREIDHLVLCVHGIGQSLGKKYQYVNFAHSINLLRTTMKKVYAESPELQIINKYNYKHDDWKDNSRIQVLPVTWRHDIRLSSDSSEVDTEYRDLPTLGDITVNGIRPIRNLLGDIVIDVLLYCEAYYRDIILESVTKRLNDTYMKFRANYQSYPGKVSLVGHSLGSLVLFDILSQQDKYPLDFDVDNFFSLGSPIGVFKLVQRTRISPFSDLKKGTDAQGFSKLKCGNLYNMYHSCDPVAYRMEPLIDKTFAQYKQEKISTPKSSKIAAKVLELGETITHENSEKVKVSDRLLKTMLGLNRRGRVDYAMEAKPWEVDIVSAIRAHFDYFEEEEIAAFFLENILRQRRPVNELFCQSLKKTKQPDVPS